jgi:hypothetical protein
MLTCFVRAAGDFIRRAGFGQRLPVKSGLKTGAAVKSRERDGGEKRALSIRRVEPTESTAEFVVSGREHDFLPLGADGGDA